MNCLHSALLLLVTLSFCTCFRSEDPKAALNLAGKIAGTYNLNTILSSNDDVKKTGSVISTVVNDTAVTVRQQTSLSISEAVRSLDQNIDQGCVTVVNDVHSVSYTQAFSRSLLLGAAAVTAISKARVRSRQVVTSSIKRYQLVGVRGFKQTCVNLMLPGEASVKDLSTDYTK